MSNDTHDNEARQPVTTEPTPPDGLEDNTFPADKPIPLEDMPPIYRTVLPPIEHQYRGVDTSIEPGTKKRWLKPVVGAIAILGIATGAFMAGGRSDNSEEATPLVTTPEQSDTYIDTTTTEASIESPPSSILSSESLDYAIELHILDNFANILSTQPAPVLEGITLVGNDNSVTENPVPLVVRDAGGRAEVIFDFHGRQLAENEQFVFAAPRKDNGDIIDLVLPGHIKSIYMTPDASLLAYQTSLANNTLSFGMPSETPRVIVSNYYGEEGNTAALAAQEINKNPSNKQSSFEDLIKLLSLPTA